MSDAKDLTRRPRADAAWPTTVAGRPAAAPPPFKGLPPELADHPRYRVVELLGQGGMGAVYRAEHRVMKRPVALKVVHSRLVNGSDAVERFCREVQAAARLSHPNIVTAHDADRAGDTHFLVMELVDGITLARLVERKGPLPAAHACEYARQVALGLQHAHEQGMVHRDVKPANLMLTRKGQVKVLDFGLARFVSETGPFGCLTESGTMAGTPDFIAPEQAEDARTADIRADVYSLGCTLYFLLTGRPPFPEGSMFQKMLAHHTQQPRPLSQLRHDLPPGLLEVFERMTAKSPARRYQAPAEVARALLLVRQGAGKPDLPAPPREEAAVADTYSLRPPALSEPTAPARADTEPAPRPRTKKKRLPARRRRAHALFLALGLVLLVGLGLTALSLFRPRPKAAPAPAAAPGTSPGEVYFRSEVPEAEVVVRRDGKVLHSLWPGPGQQLSLPPGEYTFQLAGGAPGYELSADRLVLSSGDRRNVDVRPSGAWPRGKGPKGWYPPKYPLPPRKP